jgi:type I restriction enzyme S subunit
MSWPTVLVGEIAQQVRGVSYDKSQVSNSAAPGLRPVLRAGNIQEGSLLLDKDLVYVPDSCIAHQQLLRPGDIVIAASSGSIDVVGKAAQLSEPWGGSFGAFCKVIRPSSERVNPRYLHHYFQSTGYRRKVSSLAAGANINNLKNEHIDDLLLPLPPLEEQRRIAAILDKAHQVKELGRQRDLQINQLELGLFLELFGNPITNALDWPTVNIGKIARVQTGNTPSRAQTEYYGDEVEWIKSDNLNNSSYYATKAAVSLSALGASLARIAPRDAILVTCIAGSPACIGNCAMADRAVAFNQQINSLEDIDGNPHFFYAMLRLFKGIVQAASTNSMKGMVSKSRFESICIINPPRERQDLFSAKMAIVRHLQCQANELPTNTDTLIKGLHKRFFMGAQVP